MRYTYLVGICLAVFLIYLSVNGAAGIGFVLSLEGSFYKEDFNTLDHWEIAIGTMDRIKINPAGQLEMLSPNGTGDARRAALQDRTLSALPAEYTVEWRMLADRIAASGGGVAGEQGIAIYASTYWIPVAFRATHISAYQGPVNPAVTYNINVIGTWHVWTMVVDSTAHAVDLWMDTQKLMSFQTVGVSSVAKISLDGYGGAEASNLDTLAHIDYIYIDSGLHPPTSPTATLQVNTDYLSDSTHVPLSGVTITVNGASKVSPASFPDLQLGTVSVSTLSTFTSGSNTYTFSVWSNGPSSNTQTYNLQTDATLTATYILNSQTGSIVATCTLDGNPYQGVSVVASGAGTGSATSNSLGLATISNLPVATGYTVTATPPNGQISSQTQSGVSVSSGSSTPLTFSFVTPTPGTATYSVYALDSLGNTIINTPCTVYVTGPNGYSSSHTSPWTFSSLAYGTYSVTATWKGETKSDSKTFSSTVTSGTTTWQFSSSDGTSVTYTVTVITQNSYGTELGLVVSAHGESKSSPASFTNINSGESITIVVPATSGVNSFLHWNDDVGNTIPSRTITVTSGKTLIAIYGQSGLNFDFIAFLNNPTVRQIELVAGALGLLVSVIMLFMPAASKPRYSYSAWGPPS